MKVWNRSDLGRNWIPPVCMGWTAVGFTTLISTVARFRHRSEAEGLLTHIGAISEFAGMRYWSTTHKQWQTLIVEAYALSGAPPDGRRKDFTPDDVTEGKVLYFEQVDNLSGRAVYRMRIAEASPNRLVFDMENVSTIRYHFIPLFHPGEMQTVYFLDRESETVWRYYSLVRTGKKPAGSLQPMSLPRSTVPLRSIAGWPAFPPIRNLRRYDDRVAKVSG